VDIVVSAIMSGSPDSIRLVGEQDLLRLARLSRGTWSGWHRNGHYAPNKSGLYSEADVVSVVLFGLLGDAASLRDAGIAWRASGAEIVEACLALQLNGRHQIAIVLDTHSLAMTAVSSGEELFECINVRVPAPRPWVALPVGEIVKEAREGFWLYAKPAAELTKDGRRKASATSKRGKSRGSRIGS
jgi:hypothetical protein